MPSNEERDIVDQLDREVSRKGTLVALAVCMILAVGVITAVAMDILVPR